MSETPERKVLKEMIGKLKTKLIQSVTIYSIHQTSVSDSMLGNLQVLYKHMEKLPDEMKTLALVFYSVISSISDSITLLSSNVNTVLADMNLYTETLERYSTELDKTLSDIFEQARKMAEEQQKKQEELRKKKPSTMIA